MCRTTIVVQSQAFLRLKAALHGPCKWFTVSVQFASLLYSRWKCRRTYKCLLTLTSVSEKFPYFKRYLLFIAFGRNWRPSSVYRSTTNVCKRAIVYPENSKRDSSGAFSNIFNSYEFILDYHKSIQMLVNVHEYFYTDFEKEESYLNSMRIYFFLLSVEFVLCLQIF